MFDPRNELVSRCSRATARCLPGTSRRQPGQARACLSGRCVRGGRTAPILVWRRS